MLFCPVCDFVCGSVNIIIRHIKFKHNTRRELPCKQPNCFRRFQNIYAFKRHILIKHRISNNDELLSKQSENTTDLAPCLVSKINSAADGPTQHSDNNSHTLACNEPVVKTSDDELNSDFNSSLSQNSLLFITKLYSNYSFPRNIVQNVTEDISEILKEPIEILKRKVNSGNVSNVEIMDSLNSLSNIFKNFNSEYFRFKQFKLTNSYIEPVSVICGQRINDTRINSRVTANIDDCTYQYIPIKKTLQHFLELPSVFDSMCSYIHNLKQSTGISNLIQGSLWKETQTSNNNKTIFPLLLYSDDFEIGNALGSHAGTYKICGVYFSLGCLPVQYSSLLENIFLAQLCFSTDVKTFGNDKMFQYLIRDLKCLETEGLVIQTEAGSHTVYFSLALILGDNLGLHSLLGLTQSFNSNNFCRFCRCNKDECSIAICENVDLLRTVENYENDLFERHVGIKEPCVWHQLPNFHLTRNLSVDIMHDIFEGICRYDLGHILYEFIWVNKFFSLDLLNNRLQFHNFLDKNKPPAITRTQVLQRHIVFSASEMNSFVKNLSLIIGDLIPLGNPLWELYLTLLEIIEIVTSKQITLECVELLRTVISEHHSLYIEHFGRLKPKHHFLVHYPSILQKIGPLNQISSIRFEAKHKQFKAAANATNSRKNILYSLATKNQLNMCYRLLSKNGFKDDIEFGSEDLNFVPGSLEYEHFQSFMKFNMSDDFFAVTWVKVFGIKYTFNLAVFVDSENFSPKFGHIRSIVIKEKTKDIYFVLNRLSTLGLDEHLRAYEVEILKNELFCLESNMLENNFPVLIHVVNQKFYIKI